MRNTLKYSSIFTLAAVATCPLAAEPQQQGSRPNIVFILSDDHRADLLGAAGHPFIKTPTLDLLGKNGVRFTNAFATSPLCTPARAGFLTGKYPERTGAPRICEKACSFLEFTRMFPELLHEAGYQTAYVGKFHLGEGSVPKRGFDYWASWDWVGEPFDLTIHINGEEHPTEGFSDDHVSEVAANFIRNKTNQDQPFFLYVGLTTPHLPFHYPERLSQVFADDDIPPPASFRENWEETGKLGLTGTKINIHTFGVGLTHFGSWDNYIKSYYRSALSIDESVKKVMDAIREKGLEENTIVIYTTDHGYFNGEHSLTEKHYGYEEVMRIPMLVQYPGGIKPGQVNEELVINLDIAPTLLDFAGLPIPEHMDGVSWKPMLTEGQNFKAPLREDFFFALNAQEQPDFKPHTVVRGKNFKLMNFHTLDHWELYDVVNDPKEMVNLATNPDYADTLLQLQKRLEELKEKASWSPLVNEPLLSLYALDSFPLEWDDQVRAEIFKQGPVDYSTPIVVNGKSLEWKRIRRPSFSQPMDLSPIFSEAGNTTYLSVPYESSKGDPGHIQFTVSESCRLALAGYFDNRLMYENWLSSDLSERRRKHMAPPHFFPYTPPVIPDGKGEILIRTVNLPNSKPQDFQASVLFETQFTRLPLQ